MSRLPPYPGATVVPLSPQASFQAAIVCLSLASLWRRAGQVRMATVFLGAARRFRLDSGRAA